MKDVMLIVHFIGLALGLGTSFCYIVLGLVAKKMESPEREEFQFRFMSISILSKIGLVFLILSGGYLMTPYWSELKSMPFMHVKLTLVAVLLILISLLTIWSKKAKKNRDVSMLPKIQVLGKVAHMVTIVIVIMAVMTFH